MSFQQLFELSECDEWQANLPDCRNAADSQNSRRPAILRRQVPVMDQKPEIVDGVLTHHTLCERTRSMYTAVVVLLEVQ